MSNFDADIYFLFVLERAGCSPLANHIGGLCPPRATAKQGAGERLNSVDEVEGVYTILYYFYEKSIMQ